MRFYLSVHRVVNSLKFQEGVSLNSKSLTRSKATEPSVRPPPVRSVIMDCARPRLGCAFSSVLSASPQSGCRLLLFDNLEFMPRWSERQRPQQGTYNGFAAVYFGYSNEITDMRRYL